MLDGGRLKLRLGPELAETLQRLADEAHLTPENWVRRAISQAPGACPYKTSDGMRCVGWNGHGGTHIVSSAPPRPTIPHGTLLGPDSD